MEIITHGKDTYEVVNEIPVGYTIWNVGRNGPEGYLPLCRPAREQPFEGARSIDTDALKAIKAEGVEWIMEAFGRGEETLDEFEQYVSRNKNSERCDIKHRVELYEIAIPYMKQVKGIEHLMKWEDCMRVTAPQDKLVSEMTIFELTQELRSRPEVFAVQVWQEEDVRNAFECELETSEPHPKMLAEVCNRASEKLEDCSYGFEILYSTIQSVANDMEAE